MTSILVLDDQATDRELLSTVLGYARYTVLEAATGEEALELARKERPDLVIVDILMPGMDGYEFVRRLRSDGNAAEVPVMFCTANYSVAEVRRLAETCGVAHILAKPCEPQEIIRMVGEALGSSREFAPVVASKAFQSEHFEVVNDKLLQKVEELEAANQEQERLHEELRQAQGESAEALTLLETLQSNAPVGFGFVDSEYRYRRVNDRLAEINGLSAEDHLGRLVSEVVPDVWPEIEPLYKQVIETRQPVVNLELEWHTAAEPDKLGHWLVSFYPVPLGGEVIGIGIVVVEITERKQAEDFRAVVMEHMAEGLYVLDAEGRLMFMNAAASRMLGWEEDELRGEDMDRAVHSQRADGSALPGSESELSKVRTEGQTVRVAEAAFTRKDSSIFPIAYSAAPLLSGTAVRGVVVVFRDIIEEQAERARVQRELDSMTWVGRTRDALEEGRLILYSQPITPIRGSEAASEELLLRMVGREGDVIPPGRFLPAAEKFGLIGDIDRWVVKQAIGLAAGGRRLAANLSADSIGDVELLSVIGHELRETGADPSKIVFEITETALMRDVNAGVAFADGVVELGCGLALDDFGTGFGSFTYLKRLPIKYLKIDIEFVRDLASNPANQHIAKAIVTLAQGFGQRTIAEGVEDAETLELLRDYGVDFAQGFHLGRPAPLKVASPDRRARVRQPV